jgi:hypothetical protein
MKMMSVDRAVTYHRPDRHEGETMPTRTEDFIGWSVVILAIGLSVSIVVGLVIAAFTQKELSDQAVVLLSTLFGGIIGTVSGYVAKSRSKDEIGR